MCLRFKGSHSKYICLQSEGATKRPKSKHFPSSNNVQRIFFHPFFQKIALFAGNSDLFGLFLSLSACLCRCCLHWNIHTQKSVKKKREGWEEEWYEQQRECPEIGRDGSKKEKVRKEEWSRHRRWVSAKMNTLSNVSEPWLLRLWHIAKEMISQHCFIVQGSSLTALKCKYWPDTLFLIFSTTVYVADV